jgi:hypothetical protein
MGVSETEGFDLLKLAKRKTGINISLASVWPHKGFRDKGSGFGNLGTV